MADWSSLPPDLIHRVVESLLVDNDIDYYMNMRAVCHNWRSAAADPCRCGDDACFRPLRWVMLDEASKDDDTRLFVNVSTGRFLRRRLPLLRVHVLLGFSDGLLVLGDRPYPHNARLFNPFTGSMVKFAAAIRPYHPVFVGVTASDPTLLFAMDAHYGMDLWGANPASERFWPQFSGPTLFGPIVRTSSMVVDRGGVYIVDGDASIEVIERTSLLAYRGDVYMVDQYASIVKIAGAVRDSTTGGLVAEMVDVVVSLEGTGTQVKKFKGCNYLAESAGDLLLIRLLPSASCRDGGCGNRVMEVYRVDVERKVLEPVKSIGGHALFLGARCVSVDAAKIPSIDGDCVYYSTCRYGLCKGIYRYSLGDGTKEGLFPGDQVCHEDSFHVRPFSIVQALHTCCNRGRSSCISSSRGAGLTLPCEGWR
ncbi:unnamed protein product [Alopecurus aequalis]